MEENSILQGTLQTLYEEKIKTDQAMRAFEKKHGVVGLSGMVPSLDFSGSDNQQMESLKEKSLAELKQTANKLRLEVDERKSVLVPLMDKFKQNKIELTELQERH